MGYHRDFERSLRAAVINETQIRLTAIIGCGDEGFPVEFLV